MKLLFIDKHKRSFFYISKFAIIENNLFIYEDPKGERHSKYLNEIVFIEIDGMIVRDRRSFIKKLFNSK